jgi:uncharacterized protein YecE (DUF72 family)
MGTTSVPVAIGTAGYAWPEWVGPFYPPGTTPERMPAYYCAEFPFVEINSTFNRPPSSGELTRLANRTAPGFQFSLRVPRTVSHEHRIRDLRPFRLAADELAARHRLIGFVLQFPESFKDTPGNRQWLERVAIGLRPYPTWVEFRHRSWPRPRLGDWLRERGLELAAVDVPDLPQLFPRGLIDAGTSRLYVRLHSRSVENWSGSGSPKSEYDYPVSILCEWLGLLRQSARRLTDAFLVFNNCQGMQAIQNARRMAELIRTEAPEFRVVDAPGPAPPMQGKLFEE